MILLSSSYQFILFFFFFNDTATTEIYTLSLHDALPISSSRPPRMLAGLSFSRTARSLISESWSKPSSRKLRRSEEHTSELQSHSDLVCRLLLEKKKRDKHNHTKKTN